MPVHLQFNPATDDWDVYILSADVHGHRTLYRCGSNGWGWESIERSGGRAAPSLIVSSEHLHEFGAALKRAGCIPKDADDTPAIKAHLADTVAIRDRLLTIVEKR